MFGTLTFTLTLFTVLTSICQARPDPPTNLKAEWIDHLTVNVSWKEPKSLPDGCDIIYEYIWSDIKSAEMPPHPEQSSSIGPARTEKTYFLAYLLTESADKWVYSVQTVSPSCKQWTSPKAKAVIEPPKPRVVMTDIKCYVSQSDMNCSWIMDPSSRVSIRYRLCGRPPVETPFSTCNDIYNNGLRRVCRMIGNFITKDVCMVVNTSTGISTFKVQPVFKRPNLKILENGTNLVLTVAQLEVQRHCLLYNICYSACDKPKRCKELGEKSLEIAYDKSCQYTFQYRAQTSPYCTNIESDWSEDITYGYIDWTLTVVAIVIPIIVSACVILSCICFRRHKDIICPDVPDPSAIFKEIINGNKDIKPSVSMYTPVQEPIEPIIIVPHIPHSSGHVPT